jgi:hypothetical protein
MKFQNSKYNQLNEGRNISNGKFTYGGFPKTLNESSQVSLADLHKQLKAAQDAIDAAEERAEGISGRGTSRNWGSLKAAGDKAHAAYNAILKLIHSHPEYKGPDKPSRPAFHAPMDRLESRPE